MITQFDGDEPDWDHPRPRAGGAPTSSSTLPSLVLRMWLDAELADGQDVLEVGTGTGYSTALACRRLGDTGTVTSIEVDPRRLDEAATALHRYGWAPDLAVADGLYGYWPSAPYDRIVAACSVRGVPWSWLAQTRPGGTILTTLTGWGVEIEPGRAGEIAMLAAWIDDDNAATAAELDAVLAPDGIVANVVDHFITTIGSWP